MICLALTGGIACGKSELGRLLGRLGAETIDSDAVVRGLHSPGGKGAEAVEAIFGGEFLLPDGSTDRARLARKVFSDRSARRRLEDALHPIVRETLLDWKRRPEERSSVRVAQIPLLFESGWSDDWDLTATVETSDGAVRFARLLARGLAPEEARSRIDSQLPARVRAAKADFAILNDGGLADLASAAEILFGSITTGKK